MKRFYASILIMAFASLLGGCSENTVTKTTETYEIKEAASYKGSDYVTVADGDNMKLSLCPDTGNLRWENKATGEYLDTTASETDLTDKTALSDIVAYYFNGTDSKKYTSYTYMDSYSYGVETQMLGYEEMDNGVRFVYELGADGISYKQFPAYISEDRMNDLVLQYLDEKQQKTVLKQFRLTKSGVYARKTNKDKPLSGLAAPELYNLFYEVGHYTYEELEADLTEYDKLDELPENQKINIVVEYTLDGDDLVVNVPAINITSNEDFPVRSIDLLPYFLSSNSDDGYFFVPDGSGALIYLDNDKLAEYRFSSAYYGGDVLQDTEVYNSAPVSMNLPVYGMKSGDKAVLGIIESGAEIAELNTYISGYYSGIDYARSTLSFYIRKEQTLSTYAGDITNYTLNKVSTDFYTDDITVRYRFLSGDDANYAGMAKSYQNYLIDNGTLTKSEETEENAPLFVDILGEIDKEKYFLGIPYDSSIALTSFVQASEIIQNLSDEGIDNVLAKYSGMVNGGLNQRSVKNVKVSGRLGGKSGYNKLVKTAEECGAEIFPSVNLQTASTAKKLSKTERSYTMAGSIGVINIFDYVKREVVEDNEYPTYVISPNAIEGYINKFLGSYKKLGTSNLASDDYFTFLAADYRSKNNVSQTTGMEAYMNSIENVSANYDLMLSDPIDLAYDYADYLDDIPIGNSEMKILDAWVPFTQMVLDGCKVYGSEYINKDAEALGTNFMRAVESGSALNFRLMYADTQDLTDTTGNDVFFAEYDLWKDDIAKCYEQYEEYYEAVKGAEIVNHEIIDRDNNKRVVTYSNGVKIYFNYSDESADIAGINVPANSYVIK